MKLIECRALRRVVTNEVEITSCADHAGHLVWVSCKKKNITIKNAAFRLWLALEEYSDSIPDNEALSDFENESQYFKFQHISSPKFLVKAKCLIERIYSKEGFEVKMDGNIVSSIITLDVNDSDIVDTVLLESSDVAYMVVVELANEFLLFSWDDPDQTYV